SSLTRVTDQVRFAAGESRSLREGEPEPAPAHAAGWGPQPEPRVGPDGCPGCGWYPRSKAAADFLAALLLFVVCLPVMLVIAALVELASPGPGIYTQRRVGRQGRTFVIYKIRTMARDCERLTGPTWSSAGDPRITALGRFLRRTHLDELPQLWNVLRGEMSL